MKNAITKTGNDKLKTAKPKAQKSGMWKRKVQPKNRENSRLRKESEKSISCTNHLIRPHQSRNPASFTFCIKSKTVSNSQMSLIWSGSVMLLRSTFRQSKIACLSSPSTPHSPHTRSCLGLRDHLPVSIGRTWLPSRNRIASLLKGWGFWTNGDFSRLGFISVYVLYLGCVSFAASSRICFLTSSINSRYTSASLAYFAAMSM